MKTQNPNETLAQLASKMIELGDHEEIRAQIEHLNKFYGWMIKLPKIDN